MTHQECVLSIGITAPLAGVVERLCVRCCLQLVPQYQHKSDHPPVMEFSTYRVSQ